MSHDQQHPRTQSLLDQIQQMSFENQREVLLSLQKALEMPNTGQLDIPDNYPILAVPADQQLLELMKINSRKKH